jgi:hypothetical protein
MTEPSIDEVEAAMRASFACLAESKGRDFVFEDMDDEERDFAREHALAVLTAAAQVREKAGKVLDIGAAGKPVFSVSRGIEPAEASRDHPKAEINVQCKCGWRGNQSELGMAASARSTITTYYCPRCTAKFLTYPAEPDNGPDVLGERKDRE